MGDLPARPGGHDEPPGPHDALALLRRPARRGRYRLYGTEDVARLAFVRRARELGFTLDEVRALLGMATDGQAACADARRLAETHLAGVRAKIADLRAIEVALAEAVQRCDAGEAPGCPLIETLLTRAVPP